MEGTVAAWVEAVKLNRVWDEERDAPRFRKAFATLSATRKTWPSPADFMEAIPAHDPQKALAPPVCDPIKQQQNIARLQALLYGGSDE